MNPMFISARLANLLSGVLNIGFAGRVARRRYRYEPPLKAVLSGNLLVRIKRDLSGNKAELSGFIHRALLTSNPISPFQLVAERLIRVKEVGLVLGLVLSGSLGGFLVPA